MGHCAGLSPNGRRSQRRTGGKSRCHRSGLTSCAWPGCAATACRRTSSTPSSAPNSFRPGRSRSWAEHLRSAWKSRRRRLPTRWPRGRQISHSTNCGSGLPRPTQPQLVWFCSSPCAAESQPKRPRRLVGSRSGCSPPNGSRRSLVSSIASITISRPSRRWPRLWCWLTQAIRHQRPRADRLLEAARVHLPLPLGGGAAALLHPWPWALPARRHTPGSNGPDQ